MLTVVGREYGADGNTILHDVTNNPIPSTDALGHIVSGTEFRTRKIDLAAALNARVNLANGEKQVDVAKAMIEQQLRILESDIGLGESVISAACAKVQKAIAKDLS